MAGESVSKVVVRVICSMRCVTLFNASVKVNNDVDCRDEDFGCDENNDWEKSQPVLSRVVISALRAYQSIQDIRRGGGSIDLSAQLEDLQ